MLDSIIQFSIKNKLIIGVLTLALVLWGTWSATRLPIDAVPDITNNQVQIITSSPSLAAQEVERLITFPVEMAVANIPGLVEVRSISRFGLSVVTVVFEDDIDVYWARQQVTEHLAEAITEIPKGAGMPVLAPVTTGLGEIYQYVLRPKKGYEQKYTATDLRTIQDWIVRRQLLSTKGVADVSSFGGYLKQYEIAVNPDKLRSMNITLGEVFTALETNNNNTGGAYIDKKPNAWFIRTEGLVNGLDDIKKIVVKTMRNGAPVFIRDVATVQYGHAVRYGAMTNNNEGEVVGAIVMMLKGANSSEVIENVKERIAQIRTSLPEGLEIEAFLDRTKLVDKAIGTVTKNLIEGALIVLFVLVLFLGNIRAGLVVASVIPLAMLFALAMMNLFGVSGNLMSLGAIDFGLIVDGAVIIVEATLHHIGTRFKTNNTVLSQQQMDEEVYASATVIRSSAAFGEIIILIVYLPILALVGVEGKMFKPMAQTVGFAIAGAFILSLTYVPMMSALFLSKRTQHKRNISDRMMDFFHRVYQPVIRLALRMKIIVLVISMSMFVVALIVFLNMGGEFVPTLDEGDFAVETRVLTGSSMSHTVDVSIKAGDILLNKFPNEVKQVVGKIGSSEIPTDPMPIEACDLMVILKDKDEWTSASDRDELANVMQEALEEIPGVEFSFQQPIQMRFNELMTGAKQDVAIKIYGEDLDVLTKQAAVLSKLVGPVEGVKDLYVEKMSGLPQIVVKYNRERMAQFGLSIDQMNRYVSTAFAGESAGLVFDGEQRFDLVVRLDEQSRTSLSDVRNLFISTNTGVQVPLSQVADVEFKLGPNQIQRDDTRRRITVAFNVRGRDVESTVEEIQKKVSEEMKLPAGYYLIYGGQFKNLLEAKERLSVAVPIAMALIFILLYFTFNSIRQSILIFTAIPLSAIGGVFALWLRGMPFSISAGVGFIALFGVAVLNGIVLIGEFNRLKKSGVLNFHDIVMKGTEIRLRPVLMTAMVASLGFLPMALSNGSGAEVQKPLATVVIGGLVSATLLTLLVLPVLYIISENGLKMNISKASAVLLLTMVLLSGVCESSHAQSLKVISMKEAMDIAVQNNQRIKAAQHQVEYSERIKGTSTEIGKTSATFTYGQYNGYPDDNNITITQSIPFPVAMVRQSQYYNAAAKSAEYSKDMTRAEILFDVKTIYCRLQAAKAAQRYLQRQDSLYVLFLKSADLKLRTGEGNALEKATAESQLYEIRMQKFQDDADIRIFETQLQNILNSEETVTVTSGKVEVLTLSLGKDSGTVSNNPALKYFAQQVKVAEAGKNVQRADLLPDITVGYFNQTLQGTVNERNGAVAGASDRFQGFTIGLAFPLWAKPQLSRIQANEASKDAAIATYEWQQKNLESQYSKAFQEYLKFKSSKEYYEHNALPLAEQIEKNAVRNYQSGNIGYLEFQQGVNRAISIQQNYLKIINQYNQSIISIEYLAGI